MAGTALGFLVASRRGDLTNGLCGQPAALSGGRAKPAKSNNMRTPRTKVTHATRIQASQSHFSCGSRQI